MSAVGTRACASPELLLAPQARRPSATIARARAPAVRAGSAASVAGARKPRPQREPVPARPRKHPQPATLSRWLFRSPRRRGASA